MFSRLNKKSFAISLMLVLLGIFMLGDFCMAAERSVFEASLDTVKNLAKTVVMLPILVPLGVITLVAILALGAINTLVIGGIIAVAQYNNFIGEPKIIEAWVIIRDLCNMFFVLILLAIAFATILKIENYAAKKMLPKLIIMAVLINFSRTIFGLMIDASQVIMLTFVHAWGAGGQFVYLTSMKDFFSKEVSFNITNENYSVMDLVAAMLIGTAFMAMSGVVLFVLLLVFIMRMVMLFIYVTLSPIIFLGFAFPPLQKYTQELWEDFIKQVIVGPILAFFVWLSLIAVTEIGETIAGDDTLCAGISGILCLNKFIPFILGLGFLVGAMQITQKMGGVISKTAGKAEGWAKSGLKLGGEAMDWGQRKFSKKYLAGYDFNYARRFKSIKSGLDDSKRQELGQMQSQATEKMRGGGFRGLLASVGSDDFAKEVLRGPLGLTGIKRVLTGGKEKEKKLLGQARFEEAKGKLASTKLSFDEGRATAEDLGAAHELVQKIAEDIGLEKPAEIANDYLYSLDSKNPTQLGAEVDSQNDKARGLREEASTKRIGGTEGDKAFLGSISEAKSKINSTDEDAVARTFMSAVNKGSWEEAAASFLKACDIGGLNTLLFQMGYSSVDGGFTEDEAKKLDETPEGRKHYMERRGVNDMIRDVFVGKLGMSQDRALAVQSEGATSCFGNNHLYGAKTVSFKDGQRKQNSRVEQREAIMTDVKKGDSETYVRKLQKSGYGGLDAKGNYQTSTTGQELMMTGWKGIMKEISQNRWNKSAAEMVGTENEIKKLRLTFNTLKAKLGDKEATDMFGTINVKIGKETEDWNINDFFRIAQKFSSEAGTGAAEAVREELNKTLRP